MRVPQIRMESQFAKIGMSQQFSRLHLEQSKAELSIEQPKATVTMRTTPSRLTIDQTSAWEQMNLKSTAKHIEENAQKSMQSVLEGMARRASQGDELMQIEHKGNPIVSHAIHNGHRQQKELGITFVPVPFSVQIQYNPSELHIEVEANKPIINAQINRPEIDFEKSQLQIYMEKYEELHIDYVHLFSEDI